MAGLSPSSQPERVHERTKEEFEEAESKPHHRHEETHGLRPDIDEQTSISDVKAPNVFGRAKEEFEAIVQSIHPKKEHDLAQSRASSNAENRHSDAKGESNSASPDSEKSKTSPNFIRKAKEEIEAKMHKLKPAHGHHHETHGRSNDIDDTTPITKVKGPNVFERAKEEVEAILEAIHPKKDTQTAIPSSTTKKEGGFRSSIGKGLEKIFSPRKHHDKD